MNNTLLKLLISLLITGCSQSQCLYLNSAKYATETSYGYSVENPIIFNLKKVQSKETIIKEYVSNLATVDASNFHIVKTNEIRIKTRNNLEQQIITECILKDDKSQKFLKLYFIMTKSQKKLKIPIGLLYGRLAG